MTPGPWRWWTSNSMRRLSSDATGKDGDVISATIASDGVAIVVVKEEDMPVIAAAREMYDALVMIRDWAPNAQGVGGYSEALMYVRRALAHAEKPES